jgi:uncharacterized protein with von Willebrand factor type A (vWA) domain
MARGWESKSVEEQMANTLQQPEVDARQRLCERRRSTRIADKHRTERERQKQALNLQRENILSQRTSNPARRAALEAALEQIERRSRR